MVEMRKKKRRASGPMSQDVFDQEEVVQGLTHLFGVDRNEPVVHVVFNHRLFARKGFDWAISFS